MSNPYDSAIVNQTDLVSDIFNFNKHLLHIGERPKSLLDPAELNYAVKAGREELEELEEAHLNQDYIGAVDAVLDLLYFGVGFLARMGLSEDEVRACMKVVHDANMQKKLGVQEKRGGAGVADAVKPTGWVPPEERIAEILGG